MCKWGAEFFNQYKLKKNIITHAIKSQMSTENFDIYYLNTFFYNKHL